MSILSRFFGSDTSPPQQHTKRDFSLESGERQTGTSLNDIRADHRYRYEKAIEMIKSGLPASKPLLGIDAFCANGYGSYMLSDALDCFVLGVDASEEAIAQANRHFSTDMTYFCCKEFPFQLPEAAYDFATCIESLEHVSEYRLLFSQLVKSLRKGGFLFVSIPNEGIMPFNVKEMPFHVKHFRNDELSELAADQGCLTMLASCGQDTYEYKNSQRIGLLPESEMQLIDGREGQFQLFAFEKT